MELTAQLSENDILVAGGVIVISLIAFIAVLWLSRSEKKKPAAGGSAFVANEDGQVVRRSTRARKPATAAEPVSPTPMLTPRAKPASAAATPVTAARARTPARDRSLTSPPRTRTKTASKTAKTPEPKSPAVSPARRRTTARKAAA